ncbi:MAG: hypothetical protein GY715_07200 [Planctomycetes bacterium]|nr:hypothetical protein [Planctomycetota bacterium]
MLRCLVTTFTVAGSVLLSTSTLNAQTFGLDDNPFAPIGPAAPVGPIPGFGAENPFGWVGLPGYPPGFAPSPSLLALPCIDGDLLATGPALHLPTPNGFYIDGFGNDTTMAALNKPIKLKFSVDRVTIGVPMSAVRVEAMANQQPGDIFTTTDRFVNPSFFAPMAGPPGFGGVLAAPMFFPGPRNNLLIDDTMLGLLCGGAPCPPSPNPAPAIGPGTHDNIDQFDTQAMDPMGAGVNFGWMYFTIYPDEALIVGAPSMPADIFDVAPGAGGGVNTLPFAIPPMMGLDLNGPMTDSIDALIMFDNNIQGGPAFGGPGGEPHIDYALFSLAPGSVSLLQWGLNASDVFYTNFTGTFWLYAPEINLGLQSGLTGGEPGHETENVDALEILYHCPEDLNGNGTVDFADILVVIGVWGPCPGCQHDLNDNGFADFADILAIIGKWGPCPP